MKNLNQRKAIQLFFLLFSILFFPACKDKDEPTPDYAGRWLSEKTVTAPAGYTKVAYTMEITDNHFTETFFRDVYQYKLPNPGKYVKIDGSVSVSGNLMKFTPSQISFSNYNYVSLILSEPNEIYSLGDKDFQTIFSSLSFPTCKYQVEFSIENGLLILKADKNGDGTYLDFDESICYTKV